MMNNDEHIFIGLLISVITGILISRSITGFNLVYILIHIGFGIGGAILPDVIEPPSSAWHRRFFHSKLLLSILLILGLLVVSYAHTSSNSFLGAISGIIVGYTSHLVADATTSMGLPDI